MVGLALTLAAVIGAAFGNVFARRSEEAGAAVAAATAWAMTYGVLLLVLFALLTHRPWTFDARLPYILSLLHLALVGLGRRVPALLRARAPARLFDRLVYLRTDPATRHGDVGSLREQAVGGVALCPGVALGGILGQWLLLRTRKA